MYIKLGDLASITLLSGLHWRKLMIAKILFFEKLGL